MKILFDLDLNTSMIGSIKAHIYQIINDNYDDYFVKTIVQEVSGVLMEIQFDYTSGEVCVRKI